MCVFMHKHADSSDFGGEPIGSAISTVAGCCPSTGAGKFKPVNARCFFPMESKHSYSFVASLISFFGTFSRLNVSRFTTQFKGDLPGTPNNGTPLC